MFNLNKVLELTLNGGRCLLTGKQLGPDTGTLADYADFAALEDAFRRQIDYFIGKMLPLLWSAPIRSFCPRRSFRPWWTAAWSAAWM